MAHGSSASPDADVRTREESLRQGEQLKEQLGNSGVTYSIEVGIFWNVPDVLGFSSSAVCRSKCRWTVIRTRRRSATRVW